MTKNELIKLLEKKTLLHSVGLVGSGGWEVCRALSPLKDSDIGFTVFNGFVEVQLWLKSKSLFYEKRFRIENLTEQNLDEILSQFTKIKTALYQIEQITKELKW